MNGGNYTSDTLHTSPNKRRNKSQTTLNDTVAYSQKHREPSTHNTKTTSNKPKSTTSHGIAGDNLRDTSVNVASAFTQAVQSYTMSHSATNGYTTATRNGVTDLSARGLGAPPPSRARKPTSRRARGADESDDDVDRARLRGKSPLVEAATNFVRALSPGGSLYLRQRAAGVEDEVNNGSFQSLTGAFAGIKSQQSLQVMTRAPGSQSQTSHQTSRGNLSSDYNYSREESLMKKMDPPPRPTSPTKKKTAPRQSGAATINVDKQAYKPPVDEEEEEEDDWSEDERGHKRRKTKTGPTRRGLDHLPVVGAQAKHRRTRKKKGKDGQEEDGSETDTGYARSSAVRSLRGSVPPRQDDTTWQDSYAAGYAADGTTSMDQPDEHYADEYAIAIIQAHPSQSAFSIGGLMGRIVNLAIRTFAATVAFAVNTASSIAILLLRLLVSAFDIILLQPANYVMDRTQKIFGAVDWSAIGKGIIALLVIWMFLNSLSGSNNNTSSSSSGVSWLPWKTSQPATPIDYSQLNGDSSKVLMALDRRLQEMENRLIDMQFSQRRAVDRIDGQNRVIDESASKIDNVESALSKAKKAQAEAEEKLRSASSAAVSSLRSEVLNMLAQTSHNSGSSMSDEKLSILEKRLIAAEAGVKDAVDASKNAIKELATKGHGSSGGNAMRLWDKFVGTDGKTVTIKSTDGHDVTSLIGNLVDSAVLRWSKDDIAKPDFASYFAGARVVPQLTTQTYRIQPKSYWGNWGLLGSSAGEGRPPVTALHPDIHVGNCWPFKGAEGQLGVMLARSIVISEFTIDHAAKDVAFDVRSAPKKMEVWGLVDGADNIRKVANYHKQREQRYRDLVNAANREGRAPPPPEDPYPSTFPPDSHYLRLAQFTYNVNAVSHIQTFTVPQEIQELGVDIGVVVLKVKSNWGEPNWTCLYRFRVHGHDVHQEPFAHQEIDEL